MMDRPRYLALAGAIAALAVATGCKGSDTTGPAAGNDGKPTLTTNLPLDSASRSALFSYVGGRWFRLGWQAAGGVIFAVRDARGLAMAGVNVHFQVDTTYLRVATSVVTDSAGRAGFPGATPSRATPPFVAANGALIFNGPLPLVVRADGVTDSIVLMYSTNGAGGGAATIAADRPADLGHFLAGQYITHQPAVVALDAFGNRLYHDQEVAWRVVQGSGVISPAADTAAFNSACLHHWILGPGVNAVEAYLPAHPEEPAIRFTAEGDSVIAGPLPVRVTIAFATQRAAEWDAAVRNAVARYSQFFTSAFAPMDVDVPADGYGGDVGYSPELVDSAWTGLHIIVERDDAVATFAAGPYIVRHDGTPAVAFLYVSPALLPAFDTTPVFAIELPLVHEVGHMLGVTNTLPRTVIQTTGVPGNDPYSTEPTALAAWRAMAPNLAGKGVPLTSPAHDMRPGDAYAHWDCSIVPDIMACLLDGATVTAVTVGAMQDAGIPISSAAADPPALDVSHEIVSPAWRPIGP